MKRRIALLLILGVALYGLPLALNQSMTFSPLEDLLDEFADGQYFTVYNEADHAEVIFITGRRVHEGDEYQTSDNRLFEVVQIDADNFRAYARYQRQVAIDNPRPEFPQIMASIRAGIRQEDDVTIGIYHTHSAESYRPSDGASSIYGDGGIFKVGRVLGESLEEEGANVVISDNRHDPHDAGAYRRSRRTVEELMRENPTALLDVHRDAVPAEAYTATVDGEEIAQVQLVVGRQNPNQSANRQFAQELKAAADEQQPNLIKGIFFARGGYNQDMHPRNLLLEMGTHLQRREKAEDGARLFASVLASYLGATGNEGQAREGRTGASTVGWLLALVIVGAAIYMVVSTGSYEELSSKIRTFLSKEFANTLGPNRRGRDKDDDTQE